MNTALNWRLHSVSLAVRDRTLVMGILNATPDSFSDGGIWLNPQAAIEHGLAMLHQGADIVDIGGESTRPGATPLDPVEEQRRVLPVISGILRHRPKAILSIDTYHSQTARLALDAGAEIVNDVSGGLWDPRMLPLCAATRCGVVLMHTRGRPAEWSIQAPLPPSEVVPLVIRDLRARIGEAFAAGIPREAIAVDPGFGFGKVQDENFPLLAGLDQLRTLGFPILAGLSRKGFLRKAIASSAPYPGASGSAADEALRDATLAANAAAVLNGAAILRVHDVLAARRAIAIADAVVSARS